MIPLLVALLAGPVQYDISCSGTFCDLYPAFAAAQAACDASPPRDRASVGCVIQLPAGRYRWSQAPTLCRAHHVRGWGGDGDAARTELVTDGGCFRLAAHGECGFKPNGPSTSSGGKLEGFMCTGTLGGGHTVGVENDSGARIQDVTLRKYVWGLWLDAAVSRGENANTWYLDDVHVWNTEHAGVVIRGPDVNQGLALALDVIDSCKDPSWNATLGTCGAIRDRSFLGNTYIAPHVALTSGGSPGYLIDGSANQRTALLSPYAEIDVAPGVLSPNSMALEPVGVAFSGGFSLVGRKPSGFELINDQDPDNVVSLRLGRLAAPGSAWDATPLSISSGAALRLFARPGYEGGRWGLNVFNVGQHADALQIQLFSTSDLPLGSVLHR